MINFKNKKVLITGASGGIGKSLVKTFTWIDDDNDLGEKDHESNGNGEPDVGETNVDEPDESKIQENNISLFPLIPTIGFTWEF